MEAPRYLALLNDDKTIIRKSSLALIEAVQEPIKYLIKVDFDSHGVLGNNESDLYAYTSVDLKGKVKPIDVGNFTVVDLGTDWFGKYANERHTFVKEKQSGEIRKFHSVGNSESFVLFHLVPLFKMLTNAGSWEAVDKFKELEEVRKENELLKSKIAKLENLKVQS